MDIYLAIVVLLLLFAVLDLTVGVTNDAVNFLNSAFASKAAPRKVVLFIASVGIICGVMFSSGMMEIARKGIFHPECFTMPELMTVFFAVVCSDVILLDLFNSHGLPTSTTVSIVFDLLGASMAAAMIKIWAGEGDLSLYINSSQALVIILGIILSIVVAFFFGALAQLFSRLIFTFEVEKRLKRYGAIWGGLAVTSIIRFILIGGAQGTSFMTPEVVEWLQDNSWLVLAYAFVGSSIVIEILILCKLNIFKPIILSGTFALALAFAANDLVNFIGVPLAGLATYSLSVGLPLNTKMSALAGQTATPSWYLLIAGTIMVLTLWFSRRSKNVSQTEISLSRQDEGVEQYESTAIARVIVRTASQVLDTARSFIPKPVFALAQKRLDASLILEREGTASYDLLRASVNLMVASALVSFATSLKLPLSTTFVTFMVAMGTSFADQAWGRESAVYRVSGVLTVISGWFLTAVFASILSFSFAMVINYLGAFGIVGLICLVIYSLRRTRALQAEKLKEPSDEAIFNLTDVLDAKEASLVTFKHTAIFIAEVQKGLNTTLDALIREDYPALRALQDNVKKIQNWSNIITANIFKSLRVLETEGDAEWHKYTQTIRCLQSVAEGYGDVVSRCYQHISDHHKGLLPVQIEELKGLAQQFNGILNDVEMMLTQKQSIQYDDVLNKHINLRAVIDEVYSIQIARIRDRSSKTRLTILFYAVIGNMRRISRQNLRLLEIFKDSLLTETVQKEHTTASDKELEPLESA